jgi:RimJ/RimL family protein N-acetyltransferase
VTLEPLNAQSHTAALWQAVRGHDDLWKWMGDGPYATQATLRQALRDKQQAKDAVFLAILPTASAEPETAGPSSASNPAPQAAEEVVVLKGHDFSRAVSAAKSTRALAPEGRLSAISLENRPFPAAGPAPPPGHAAGFASYMRIEPAHGVVEVGNILLAPSLQRTTAATEAMFLMASHVFDHLGYRRYEWKCNAENGPSRRAALRLGFTFEGIFRQHMVVKGKSRDTAWFALLDSDWPARKRAFEAWLAPANFDAQGRQRQSLAALLSEIST